MLVVHPYLTELGGAEKVFLHIVEALQEQVEDVVVLGSFPKQSEFQKVRSAPIVQTHYPYFDIGLNRFQVYQRFLWHELLRNGLRRKIGKVDLEILSQDPMFLVGAGKRRVAYVHYPENLWRLEGGSAGRKRFWKLFYLPVTLSLRRQVSRTDLLFCNSEYTRKAIMAKWGRTAQVIYPPVDVEGFTPAPKEKFVVTVGRFVSTKNYELILEVARIMPQIKFIIVGRKPKNDEYYEKIKESKPSNLLLLANLPYAEMISLLGRAKVYLHTMVGEHFGISVVEAMAAGCIPIVHDSGGTKEAIGNFGYIYNDTNECVKCINTALNSKVEPAIFADRASNFSVENFKKNLIDNLKGKGFL